jgi:hypothetical protein
MTKKTKAEKIAASLRTKRQAMQTLSHNVQKNTTQPDHTEIVLKTEKAYTVIHMTQNDDVKVYDPKDLRKTFVTTIFIVALLTLVYVFQYKGYF